MRNPLIKKYAPLLWVLSGLLFLLPVLLGKSQNPTPIGVGLMFIIFS